MVSPLQLVVDGDTQIPEGIHSFKGVVVDAVGERGELLLPCDARHFAFPGV